MENSPNYDFISDLLIITELLIVAVVEFSYSYCNMKVADAMYDSC